MNASNINWEFIGDEDACGAPKLLLRDVSFIKLQLFVVLNKLVEKFGIPQLVHSQFMLLAFIHS
jgi:predicted rRNA methylase YqxC with S4 and FtsJ domains